MTRLNVSSSCNKWCLQSLFCHHLTVGKIAPTESLGSIVQPLWNLWNHNYLDDAIFFPRLVFPELHPADIYHHLFLSYRLFIKSRRQAWQSLRLCDVIIVHIRCAGHREFPTSVIHFYVTQWDAISSSSSRQVNICSRDHSLCRHHSSESAVIRTTAYHSRPIWNKAKDREKIKQGDKLMLKWSFRHRFNFLRWTMDTKLNRDSNLNLESACGAFSWSWIQSVQTESAVIIHKRRVQQETG